jgi:hypothetical protein
LGAYEKNLFWMKWCLFYFHLTFTVTCRHTIFFYGKYCFIIDEIILLMLKLVSNKIDTYLTSLWRHERYLFSVFHGNFSAIFGRFSKKLSTICWIVSKKYLLLLDQTILIHFRSSIDRPLNGYLRIHVVITISVSKIDFFHKPPIIDYIFSSGILK